jgi:hypothetical protein
MYFCALNLPETQTLVKINAFSDWCIAVYLNWFIISLDFFS